MIEPELFGAVRFVYSNNYTLSYLGADLVEVLIALGLLRGDRPRRVTLRPGIGCGDGDRAPMQ